MQFNQPTNKSIMFNRKIKSIKDIKNYLFLSKKERQQKAETQVAVGAGAVIFVGLLLLKHVLRSNEETPVVNDPIEVL